MYGLNLSFTALILIIGLPSAVLGWVVIETLLWLWSFVHFGLG